MLPLSSLPRVLRTQSDPVGGQAPPATPPADPPATPPPPGGAAPPAPAGDPGKVFDEEYVKTLRGENAQWRTKFQEQKKLSDQQLEAWKTLGASLGVADPTQPPDPGKLQEQVGSLQRQNRDLLLSGALNEAAAKHGADRELLAAVLAHQKALEGLDPSAATFAKDVNDLVKATVEKNPKLKASQVPGRSGAEFPGGTASVQQLTRDQLKTMNFQQIEEARQKGQLDQLLGRLG